MLIAYAFAAQPTQAHRVCARMQVDLNMRFEFDAITEAGSALVPLAGPGHVGLVNLGNSCYMNSCLQVGQFAGSRDRTSCTRVQRGSQPILQKRSNRRADDKQCHRSCNTAIHARAGAVWPARRGPTLRCAGGRHFPQRARRARQRPAHAAGQGEMQAPAACVAAGFSMCHASLLRLHLRLCVRAQTHLRIAERLP